MNITQFKNSEPAAKPHLMLVGNPVAHSLSPLMHNLAVQYYGLSLSYHAVSVAPDELSTLAVYLNNENLRGMNVTIPYKQTLLDYVDEIDASCRQIGAMNTIVKDDLTLVGHNTDVYGFAHPLENCRYEIEGTRAIVFGTGGAARAIVYGLMDFEVEEIILVSRNTDTIAASAWPDYVQPASYDSWPMYIDECSLLVNATPLGMEPDIAASPVRDDEINLLAGKICYDIVYKPLLTTFLRQAKSAGARTIGGLEMLIHQGSRSFELWTGKTFPIDIIRNRLHKYFNDGH